MDREERLQATYDASNARDIEAVLYVLPDDLVARMDVEEATDAG